MMRSIVCLAASFSGLAAPALAAMSLTSNDIQAGGEIPLAQIYTRCGGENISPELTWRGAPAGTKSFVLTMIDQQRKAVTLVPLDRGGPPDSRDNARARSKDTPARRQGDRKQFR